MIYMQKDRMIFDLIDRELERQRNGIELIASPHGKQLHACQWSGCGSSFWPGDQTIAGVVWLDGGVVTIVAGPLDAQEVLSVADGLA